MTEAFVKSSAVSPNDINYVTSAPVDGVWGQLPASYYTFTFENGVLRGRLIHGIYQRLTSSARTRYDETLSPETEALLNRTIKEHYDLWAELAKR